MVEIIGRLKNECADKKFGEESTGTFDYLGTLPRVPLPSLVDTVRRFKQWCRPLLTDKEWQQTQNALIHFARPGGPGERLHQAILEDDQPAAGYYSWLDTFWSARYLGRRTPVAINANFFFSFRLEPENQISRAASLVAAAADYKYRLSLETLPPSIQKGIPLCMAQNKYLFGSSRLPGEKRDDVTAPYSSARPGPATARYIIVLHQGHFYQLDVFSPSNEIYGLAEIREALQAIVDESDLANMNSVGYLTTLPRTDWANERAYFCQLSEQNAANVKLIDEALFCLCLDDAAPDDVHAASEQLLHGNGANRWFDKSVSLVVFRNGRAGINIEHCGLDGTTVVEFINALFAADTLARVEANQNKNHEMPQHQKMYFDLDSRVNNSINRAAANFQAAVGNTSSHLFTFNEFGAAHMKALKSSPDAFTQIAFQLAHYRTKGFIGATYESIATRTYERGRTEAMRVVTPEMMDFVSKMTDSLSTASERVAAYRAAANAHVQRARECQAGQAPEQHLWQMRLIASQRGDELGINEPLTLFDSPGWLIPRDDYLSTSSAPSEHCETFGFGATSDHCIGVGYIIRKNELCAFLSGPKSGQQDILKFSHSLNTALHDIAIILEKDLVNDVALSN